jgi:hypothetical protein
VEPVRPDYEGGGITNLIRGLQSKAAWVPEAARNADSVVLLILDGLGHEEITRRRALLPNISQLEGAPITSVVPSTTPTALSSISTGLAPSEHGIIGYRMWLGRNVLNVIRWAMQGQDPPEPEELQPREAFNGQSLPVVSRAQFRDSKFSSLLYRGAAFHGYFTTSGLVERCRLLVEAGERFIYAYYDGPDLVAHVHGMKDGFFASELEFCDRLVGELLASLPSSTALVVTADHGHVHFEERIELDALNKMCTAQSGESRFRYLHAREGVADELFSAASELFSSKAWCFTRDQLIDESWLGPQAPSPEVRRRIGDVILAAREPIGFVDPANPGEGLLQSGHGSLTPDEMLVPLLAGTSG